MMNALKACVEVSRHENGEDVAREISGKIKTKIPAPKFILLFSTIDYKDEFKQILRGIKTEFPDSPLIGGTVTGLMTHEGCFTRGVAALAVHSPQMDVAVGVGHATKRSPQKAGEECAKAVRRGLEKSKYRMRLHVQ